MGAALERRDVRRGEARARRRCVASVRALCALLGQQRSVREGVGSLCEISVEQMRKLRELFA